MSELPSGWVETTLSNVVDILDSKRIPVNQTERAKRPGPIPYYGATGQVGWIDDALFDEELVLLGEDGAPFLDRTKPKAYVINGPSWVNNHAHVLRALAGVTSNRFLKHWLDSADYGAFVNGTTRLKLTQTAMKRIPVSLPPEAEQRRIVEAIEEQLSRVEAAEASLAHSQRLIQQLRVAHLERILSGDWEWTTVGQVAEVQGGIQKQPKRRPVRNRSPFLRVANVLRGRLDLTDVHEIELFEGEIDRFRLQVGDLLVVEGTGASTR